MNKKKKKICLRSRMEETEEKARLEGSTQWAHAPHGAQRGRGGGRGE